MVLNELGKLYSVEDIAERLNVSSRTIYNWINQGKLKVLRLGGSTLRIAESELNNFVLQSMNVKEEK
ncbi:excisionase [Geobacillus thermodenitrificans]|jgi:excisionase family DNA binding protein|uniref:helix-turn-helix domain-containing protein n=1 Tax=Geobacillus thermodenitrificans TaxID=33940 RepID=UPI000C2932D2|nr:helix-turn-helix domain-containing protein [Geobacillus thermodenitrificans]PJW20312.1 excisionase [Geobacillus thermodenitrificans]